MEPGNNGGLQPQALPQVSSAQFPLPPQTATGTSPSLMPPVQLQSPGSLPPNQLQPTVAHQAGQLPQLRNDSVAPAVPGPLTNGAEPSSGPAGTPTAKEQTGLQTAVTNVKAAIERTKTDPYHQAEAIVRIKAEYLNTYQHQDIKLPTN